MRKYKRKKGRKDKQARRRKEKTKWMDGFKKRRMKRKLARNEGRTDDLKEGKEGMNT